MKAKKNPLGLHEARRQTLLRTDIIFYHPLTISLDCLKELNTELIINEEVSPVKIIFKEI